MTNDKPTSPRAHPVVDLRDYTQGIHEQWPESDIYRVMMACLDS